MRLPRPHIPILLKLDVAERQRRQSGQKIPYGLFEWLGFSQTARLKILLRLLFGDDPAQLDHDPALQNRKKLYNNGIHVAYAPPANHPDYLVWRRKDEHKIKTLVRGDGAQYSDAALARKNKRIARNRDPKRKRFKWPKRKMRKAR